MWGFFYFKCWRTGRDSNPRPPAWQAGILTDWTTGPHISQHLYFYFIALVHESVKMWWAVQDSNLWPMPCKGIALPTELTAQDYTLFSAHLVGGAYSNHVKLWVNLFFTDSLNFSWKFKKRLQNKHLWSVFALGGKISRLCLRVVILAQNFHSILRKPIYVRNSNKTLHLHRVVFNFNF